MRLLTDLLYPIKTYYPVWEPPHITDRYETINKRGSVRCPITYDALQKKYDKLGLKKELIKDISIIPNKSYNVYEYIHEPKNYSYTVMLSAGMNGCEIPGVIGLFYFMKFMLTSKDPGMTWIRENCKISVIPCICGYSFDCRTYTNANLVNINRNFNYNGNWYATASNKGSWNYAGTYPESEPETQMLLAWFDKYRNADIYIDCHTDVTRIGNKPLEKTFDAIASDQDIKDKVLTVQSCIKIYYEKKGLTPTEPWCIIAEPINYPKQLIALNKYGIPSIQIEQHAADKGHDGNGKVCSDADLRNYIMMIRSYILAAVRND